MNGTPMTLQMVTIETSRGVWHASLFVPNEAMGALVLVPDHGDSGFQALTMVSTLLQSRIAVLMLDGDFWLDDRTAFDLVADLERGMKLGELGAWLASYADTRHLPWGLLGAGAGALPAMVAAAVADPSPATLIVVEGGPDMASADLESISVPTLLVVSADSPLDVEIHRVISEALHCSSSVAVVDDLVEVRAVAVPWLLRHFQRPPSHSDGLQMPLDGASL